MNQSELSHPLIMQKLVAPNQNAWDAYTQHDFLQQLAEGSLPIAAFKYYLQQDYLFLKHYARAYALAIYKGTTIQQMSLGYKCLDGLLGGEINLHLDYCQQWGIDVSVLEELEEGVATVAYTRFVLDTGLTGDLLDLYVALAPCALGYAQIGQRLFIAPETQKEGNAYWPWIETYAGEEFTHAVSEQMTALETLLEQLPEESPRWRQLQRTFSTATNMEAAFWQQALDSLQLDKE